MYGHHHFTAFTGFAVAADASGVFAKLGVVGPLLNVLHVIVGVLLLCWLVAFGAALLMITARRFATDETPITNRAIFTAADPAT